MKYTLNAGESSVIKYVFPDLNPKPGYPNVTILDEQDNPVSVFPATLTANQDEWAATVTIPDVDASDLIMFTAKWELLDQRDRQHTAVIPIIIHPSQNTQSGDLVVFADSGTFNFVLPAVLTVPGDCTIEIYQNNERLFSVTPSNISPQTTETVVTYSGDLPGPSLVPTLVMVSYLIGVNYQQAAFNLWTITPRIMTATMELESWINKARVQQTIPQLEYTQADLLLYLERGLNLFNSYEPALTWFTGTNMQGILYELWQICATYYALGAQLQAEGALSFDFGGQAVTLSVDRTGQIEGALGRVEGQMSERIPPTKRLLARSGIRGGDGSEGTMTGLNPASLGRTGLTLAPTTRISYGRGPLGYGGRRF